MSDLPAGLGDSKRLMAVQTLNPGYRQALALAELDRGHRSYSAWFKAQCRLRPELCPVA